MVIVLRRIVFCLRVVGCTIPLSFKEIVFTLTFNAVDEQTY